MGTQSLPSGVQAPSILRQAPQGRALPAATRPRPAGRWQRPWLVESLGKPLPHADNQHQQFQNAPDRRGSAPGRTARGQLSGAADSVRATRGRRRASSAWPPARALGMATSARRSCAPSLFVRQPPALACRSRRARRALLAHALIAAAHDVRARYDRAAAQIMTCQPIDSAKPDASGICANKNLFTQQTINHERSLGELNEW